MSKNFKMYITITDIIGKKRIDLAYPIQGKEVPLLACLQYKLMKPCTVEFEES